MIIRESKSKNIKMLLISIGVIALLILGIQWDDIEGSALKFYACKTLSIISLPIAEIRTVAKPTSLCFSDTLR